MSGLARNGRGFITFVGIWLMSLATTSMGAVASEQVQGSAHEVIRVMTSQIMAVVAEADDYAEEDPERYYQAIDELVGEVIDYRGFARKVMGPYASKKHYRSLDERGREKLRGQLVRFTEVLRTNLVTTYSKGLLAFSGSRIELSDSGREQSGQKTVSVKQLIYSDGSQPYVLMYQMGLDKNSQWKLRNLIIDSINLGEIYKNQFQAAARKQNGDLDAVIDNWSSAEVKS